MLEHQQKKTLFETVNDWLERFYNEKGFKVAAKIEENIKKLKMSTKKKFEVKNILLILELSFLFVYRKNKIKKKRINWKIRLKN